MFESFKLTDLKNIFWIKIKTNPIPNSTAERTKKKKVRDNKFKLSKSVPILSTIKYKVIQSSSAVKSRCKAVVTLVLMLVKRIKKTNM